MSAMENLLWLNLIATVAVMIGGMVLTWVVIDEQKERRASESAIFHRLTNLALALDCVKTKQDSWEEEAGRREVGGPSATTRPSHC